MVGIVKDSQKLLTTMSIALAQYQLSIFFGDLGQLGPVESRGLHIRPSQTAAPAELAGFGVYRDFQDVIVLKQTMREDESKKKMLDRLLRIRSGKITQQDWLDINARYEPELLPNERINFQNTQSTITLHQTWLK